MNEFAKNTDDKPAIVLGQKYRDKIHGFEGVATAQSRYLHGCDRVYLERIKDTEVKGHWFDIPQIEGVEIPAHQAKTGGPQRVAPSRPTG